MSDLGMGRGRVEEERWQSDGMMGKAGGRERGDWIGDKEKGLGEVLICTDIFNNVVLLNLLIGSALK